MPGAVSVCIPTIGRPTLAAALASVDAARARAPFDVDVVVADAGRGVAAPGARVVPNPSGGAAAGRNAAAAAARGELLVFLDDDCRLDPAYLERLAARRAREPRFHAYAGVTERDPSPDPVQRAWNELFDGSFSLAARHPWLRWAPTCNLVLSRAALEAVGGFDGLSMPVGGEDADLGLRLVAAGLGPVRAAPELLVRHAAGDGDLTALEEKARRYGRSEQLVGDRHPGFEEPGRPRPFLFTASPRGRLLRAFAEGNRTVRPVPRRYSFVLMADCLNDRDRRLAVARCPLPAADEVAARLDAAGLLVLDRRADGARAGWAALLVYLRAPAPAAWPALALPEGATLGPGAAHEREAFRA